MNKFYCTGNLTKKPELHYTQGGTAYTRLNVAVSRPFSSKTATPATDFFDVTAWGKTAEFCEKYFDKGSRILIEGRLENNNYTDKNGVKHYSNSITAESIEFAGGKRTSKTETPANDDASLEDEVGVPF